MYFSTEPIPTAFLLTVFGVLLGICVLAKRWLDQLGVPVALLFLILGMLAGSEGLGRIAFEDYQLAFRLGTLALILILFDGGMNTRWSQVRGSIAPASLLATVGVVITAGITACAARLLGLSWPEAMLLGAVVSSTDAATVFAVLRGSNLALKRRVGSTLELESGLNDPMAVILTVSLTAAFSGSSPNYWSILWTVPVQLIVGGGVGVGLGYLAQYALSRVRLETSGLYPILTLAVAFLAFGVATLLNGSGFLAVYIAAMILGNSHLPSRSALLRVHDAMAWLSQIGMFLMLGLLVFPSQLLTVAGIGLALALSLAVVARPVAVAICLLPMRYPWRETGYLSWVGLRGAVPIILATFPLMAQVPGAARLFDIVFFIVVVNAVLPGSTVRWLTRRWNLSAASPPSPPAVLEINSTLPLEGNLEWFYIEPSLAVCNATLAEIDFPAGASAVLLVRNDSIMTCRGDTRLLVGDHIYLYFGPEHQAFIELLFGKPQE